ncbi:MAG TPA: serine/threonine-protein kinase [Polyangiaceae bacterium]|nr:serine/threonine-protein kinase [Polyangiaceae bacterium]
MERQRVGPYELRAKIADGGMAEVYVARRVGGGGEVVAIKMIRDEFARGQPFLTMFMDEAKIVSRLRHPNIASYLEFGNDDGHLFLAMELLRGQSLWCVWEACRRRGIRLRYDVIAWVGARVAEGLHYAHDMADDAGRPLDIVHRDVNASNIFVTYDGEPKIIDFGLAKSANRLSRTAAGVIKGKLAYMSPEQAMGSPVDRRTDVFALATTLWELACDRRLFKRSDDVETLRLVHAAQIPDPTSLVDGFPQDLWRVLRRALAKERADRYATAAELARELDAFVRSSGPGVDPALLGRVMRDLFADDVGRQAAWIEDATARHPTISRVPLKPRSPQATSGPPPGQRASSSSIKTRVLPIAIAVTVLVAGAVAALVLR